MILYHLTFLWARCSFKCAICDIFGLKKDEIVGRQRNLLNGQLQNLYFMSDIITASSGRRMRWSWNVAHMGKKSRSQKEGRKEITRKT
jgi:hypothetical protein